jgi:hypothetical protein
VPHGVRPK